jgi:3-oxo-5alpha-steroid 4-dehydrogenase
VEATVVIVGFGAAGACAAIEAAESGADVLVVDRFTGGGATAISGGIVYAGGGTRQQLAAGIKDNPEMMYGYLRHETRDAVPAATLRRFCEESAGLLAWLEDHGVPFDATLCPYKTSTRRTVTTCTSRAASTSTPARRRAGTVPTPGEPPAAPSTRP